MLRASTKVFGKFKGPSSASTRGYTSTTFREMVANTLKAADHYFNGRKPSFPVGDMTKFVTLMEKERETTRQINAYLENCEAMRNLAKKAAEAAAEDAAVRALALLAALLAALVKAILEADSDLDELEAEAKKERDEIMAEIKAAKLEKDKEQAALDELEKQYITWTDWYNNTTGAEKMKCKAAIARAVEAEKAARSDLASNDLAFKAIETARKLRAKEQEELILSLD